MAGLAVWVLFGLVVLQAYAGAALLRGTGHRLARGSLAVAFFGNALLTFLALMASFGVSPASLPASVFDVSLNAALVLGAEGAAAAIAGRRPHAGAVPVALLVAGAPAWMLLSGQTTPPTFTVLTFAFVTARLAEASLRAKPEAREHAWGIWLLAAFAPRAVEGAIGYGLPWTPQLEAFAWLQIAAALVIGLAAVATVAVALRHPVRSRALVLVTMLGAGGLLAVFQSPLREVDPLVQILSFAMFRPAVLLAGIAGVGLLGAALSRAVMIRHAVILAGAFVTMMTAFAIVPALVRQPDIVSTLPLATALALVSLPLWALAAEWALPTSRPLVTERTEEPSKGSPSLRPGLDAACRYTDEQLEFYERARRAVDALPAAQRAPLASMTRAQRVLLALRGSSPAASLGSMHYSQTGLQVATHIPYKHVGAVVRALNEAVAPARWVESSSGVRGVRYYWLTSAGTAESERLMAQLGLPSDLDLRLFLGEAFLRSRAPHGTPPAEGAAAPSMA